MRYKDKLILGGIFIFLILIVFIVYRKKYSVIDTFFVDCDYDSMLPVEGTYQYRYQFMNYSTLSDSIHKQAYFRTDINKMYISYQFTGGAFAYNNVLYLVKNQFTVDSFGVKTIFDKYETQQVMSKNNLYMDIRKDGVSKCIINIKNINYDVNPNQFGISSSSTDYNAAYYGFKLGDKDKENNIIRGSIPASGPITSTRFEQGFYDIFLKDISKCPQPCTYTIEDGRDKCGSCSNSESVQLEYIKDSSSPPNCTGSAPPSKPYTCKGVAPKCGAEQGAVNCERAQNKYRLDNNLNTGTDAWNHYLKIGSYEGKSWPSDECNCKLGNWTPADPQSQCTSCDPTGTGVSVTQTRTVEPAQGNGTCSESNPPTTKQYTCTNVPLCSDNCTVDWSPPTAACEPKTETETCGAGKGKRIQTGTRRSIAYDACNKLSDSSKPSTTKIVECDLPACATCTSTDWQTGSCISPTGNTCGPGTRTRTRIIRTQNASSTGCNESVETTSEPCPLGPCVNCTTGHWQTNNQCIAINGGNCGPGKITYTRTVTEAGPGGVQCTPEQLQTSYQYNCDLEPCSADCQYTWSEWSSCSKTCDTATEKGVQTRRPIGPNGQGDPIQPRGNGTQCPVPQERFCQPANTICPIDCSVKKDWYDAPGERCLPDPTKGKNCGAGNGRIKQIRELNPANETGKCTLEVERYRACDLQECPVDCVIGPWTPDVSQCSTQTGKKCGQGVTMQQTRTITPARFGGQCIDPDSNMAIALETTTQNKTINCGLAECGIKCIPSPWSPWGACEGKCDEGIQKRTRSVERVVAEVPNVSCSPEELQTEETQVCALKPCVGLTQLYEIRRGKAFDLNHFDMTDKAARYISFPTRLR